MTNGQAPLKDCIKYASNLYTVLHKIQVHIFEFKKSAKHSNLENLKKKTQQFYTSSEVAW